MSSMCRRRRRRPPSRAVIVLVLLLLLVSQSQGLLPSSLLRPKVTTTSNRGTNSFIVTTQPTKATSVSSMTLMTMMNPVALPSSSFFSTFSRNLIERMLLELRFENRFVSVFVLAFLAAIPCHRSLSPRALTCLVKALVLGGLWLAFPVLSLPLPVLMLYLGEAYRLVVLPALEIVSDRLPLMQTPRQQRRQTSSSILISSALGAMFLSTYLQLLVLVLQQTTTTMSTTMAMGSTRSFTSMGLFELIGMVLFVPGIVMEQWAEIGNVDKEHNSNNSNAIKGYIMAMIGSVLLTESFIVNRIGPWMSIMAFRILPLWLLVKGPIIMEHRGQELKREQQQQQQQQQQEKLQ